MTKVNIGKVLAVTIIVISACASVGYAIAGDWRRAIYWLGAAVVNATVVF